MAAKKSPSPSANDQYFPAATWCLPAGLIGLLVYLLGGLALETLHGFKAVFYLEDKLRRELWTLAHAHGTLFSALCLLLVVLLPRLELPAARARRIDRLFAAGSVLLPLGFFLGGVAHPESDPNLLIVLVPLGGLLAAGGLGLCIWSWWGNRNRG